MSKELMDKLDDIHLTLKIGFIALMVAMICMTIIFIYK